MRIFTNSFGLRGAFMYTLDMTDRIKGNQFWVEFDEAKGPRSYVWISEQSGVALTLINSAKHRRSFLSFDNTVRVCRVIHADLNSFTFSFSDENDRFLVVGKYSDCPVGKRFWMILDDVLRENGWSWRYVSGMSGVAPTTISTAKGAGRTLPFDITVALLQGMHISPMAMGKWLVPDVGPENIPVPSMEEGIETERNRLIRTIRRMDFDTLMKVADYVDYIVSRDK